MIVVAIIGILAAVAIPSYQDYTARAQVSEGVSLTSAFKTPLAEYYAVMGNFGAVTITNLGGTTTGKYVDTITIIDNAGGTIGVRATFLTTGVAAAIQGSTFVVSTEDGGKSWLCGSLAQGAIAQDNAVATKLTPGACK